MNGTERKEAKAICFDIQRYSLHDGPGIRTLVFLKGCPLRCLWCCNPESQKAEPEVEFHKDACRGCGKCLTACGSQAQLAPGQGAFKIDKDRCLDCGACAAVCESGALRMIGRTLTAEEAFAEIKRDSRYFRRSGGGVTLSGGEPLIWADFCEALLKACYDANIQTAVETTGCVPAETLLRVAPYVDTFLYDVKAIDPVLHEKATGVTNEKILENLRMLRRRKSRVVMRIPLIPAFNFAEEELQGMLQLADELGIGEVNLMPYHDLGRIKYERLCRPYPLEGAAPLKFAEDFEAQLAPYQRIFDGYPGVVLRVGG